MTWLRQILFRVASLFRRRNLEADMAEEMRQHLEIRIQERIDAGLSPREARSAAQREFGNIAQIQEQSRDERHFLWLEQFVQDLRQGMRALGRNRGFSAVIVLTLAFGIGANTAIFSVVQGVLLRPLPFAHPEQLVIIQDDLPGVGARDAGLSEPEWQDLQRSGIFEYVSPTWYDDNNVTGGSRPSRVSLLMVAPNYFSLLGVTPQLGRTFNPEDHSPGITAELVISDGLWKREFGGRPDILGKSLRMDTDLYRVVGVMPAGYHDPGRTRRDRNIEVWASSSFYGAPLADHPLRNRRNLPTAIARLKPGLSVATAQSQVDALVASLQKQFPGDYPRQSAWTVRLVPLQEGVTGNVRQSLFLLLGAVGLVLLIGCVNVANLMLARASSRSREMSIRQALGAGRTRLLRQLLTESLLLSLLGGVAGVALLAFLRDFLLRLVPEELPQLNEISIDWGVLLFALGVSLIAGAIFGLAPALQAGRLDLVHMLKREGRGSSASREQVRTRRILVVIELALSLVLMIAASLLVRSFWDLLHAPLGYDPDRVMTIRTRLPFPNDPTTDAYATVAQQAPFFREILRRSRTLPGVEAAAVGDFGAIPLGHDRTNQNPPLPVILEDRVSEGGDAPLVDQSIVTPEYFSLMGMKLLRGRWFTDFDNDHAPGVAVINEAMARAFWPGENALGKRLKLSRKATDWATVVGIVADARTESIEDPGIPQAYVSLYQMVAHHLAIFLRGDLDPGSLPDALRDQVQAVDATLPVFGAQLLDETVSASLTARRFSMGMVALFALTALFVAGLGIYGVISFVVGERTHEFGIRVALGAQPGDITWMILRQGLDLALAGTAVGLVGALLVSNLFAGFLFGVKPTDPLTLAGVAIVLVGVALGACYIPARRARSTDPIVALRAG